MRRKEEKRFPTKIPHLWVIGSCVDGTNLTNFAKKNNCSVFFNNRFRFFCSIKFADFKNGVKSQSFDLKTFFLKRKCLHSKTKSNYSFKWKRSSSGWFNLAYIFIELYKLCIQLYYYKSDLMNRGRLKKLISLCLMFDEKKCQDRKGIVEHWYVYFLLIYCNLNHNLILNPKNVFQNLAIIPHSNKLFLTF